MHQTGLADDCSTAGTYVDNLLATFGIDSDTFSKLFYTSGGDYSLTLLGNISGTMSNLSCLSGGSPYAVIGKQVVEIFTRGMFSIALTIFTYTLIMGTIYTTSEGEFMGRKMQTYFVLFRSITAMGLYLPMSSGYSMLQILITNIVIVSVMLANMAWYMTVSTIVVTLKGPLGIAMLSSVSEQFSADQVVSDAQTNATNYISDQAKTYLSASKVSDLVSGDALIMGQFTQVLCLYDKYAKANSSSGISNAYTQFNSKIGSTAVVESSDAKYIYSIDLDNLDDAEDSVYKNTSPSCGKLQFSVTSSDYSGPGATLIRNLLMTLNTTTNQLYQIYNDNGGNSEGISALQANNTAYANTLINATASLVSNEIQTYETQTAMNSNNVEDETWIDYLVDGGWAMAANNYYHFTSQIYSQASNGTSTNVNYDSYLYVTPMGYTDATTIDNSSGFCKDANSSSGTTLCGYVIGDGPLATAISSAFTSSAATSDPSSSSDNTMYECAEDITQCANIKQYLMAKETVNGNTEVTAKEYVKVFYSGWKSQIDDLNDIKTFAQIESMNRLCNVPFASSSLNECKEDGLFMSPATAAVVYPTVIAAAATGITLLPRIVSPIFFTPFLVLTGSAFYDTFDSVAEIAEDPSKMYPKPMAYSVQSFTYFTVKAWYDVFASNQGYLFMFPVQAISAFGFRVLLYTVSFIWNVGTGTFAANISMTLNAVVNQVLIDTSILLAQWYASVPQDYGWWWMDVLFDAPGVFLLWEEAVMDTDLPLVLPFPILIPLPFFILVVNYIIGPILIGVGWVVQVVSILGTLFDLFNPQLMILQINTYITSQWNPIYFAISVPLISFATLFAFFLPMYPTVIYTLSVITWLTQYIETLLAMPIILLGMANPEGHSPLLGKAIMLLALLFVRPVGIVMGFVLGNMIASISTYMFFQIIIPILDLQIGQWAKGYAMLTTVGNQPIINTDDPTIVAIMTMVALIMFTLVYYYILLNAYSLIYKLPNSISSWIGVQVTNSKEEEIVQQLAGEINNLTGQLTSASNQVSAKQGEASQAGGSMDTFDKYEKGKKSYSSQMSEGKKTREKGGGNFTNALGAKPKGN